MPGGRPAGAPRRIRSIASRKTEIESNSRTARRLAGTLRWCRRAGSILTCLWLALPSELKQVILTALTHASG
jgi:hypothetical protein